MNSEFRVNRAIRITQYALIFLYFFVFAAIGYSQEKSGLSVWVPDLGNGSYKNPILYADYSDPDVCRVGDDYYLVSSSFDAVPGIPVLHSKDLVNWTILGHVFQKQIPLDVFAKIQHGNGVWAPAIRFHNNEFYIYYPDPDFGIYLSKSKNAAGPWSEPVLVKAGKGLIDPCPLWDDDGKGYLVHAYAGSRAGIKSIIVVRRLNEDGTKIIDEGSIVYDGHVNDPTIEGPKFYKRNGFYYIFAPAGGVTSGWQVVLRSKNIYGPYERKIVMDQGSTEINGPHQGAWVDTKNGEDWFIHFQDKGPYGRVVHLQPLKWVNDWPVIGLDKDGDGKGEPVLIYKKPNVGKSQVVQPSESDEFTNGIGLQWQWQANPEPNWLMNNAPNGTIRLYAVKTPDRAKNLWEVPNLLLQKFPAEEFTVTAKINFKPNTKLENEKIGMIVMGYSYAHLSLLQKGGTIYLVNSVCKEANKGGVEAETNLTKLTSGLIYLRATISKGAKVSFSYSLDGNKFEIRGEGFLAEQGRWVGAKVGLYCTGESVTNDMGFAEVDWFRITK
jgi:beta-xylosidase